MRTTRPSLSLVLLLAGPVAAQEVAECPEIPPVTALVEPWEETSASLGAGAIRIALLEEVEGADGVGLLVLTLPPPEPVVEPAEGAEALEAQGGTVAAPLPPPERRCRLVSEGGIGFAVLDIAGLETEEDPDAATLTASLPALRFIPETTQLEEVILRLTFGVRDDSLTAAIEAPGP